jgi:hypothetical protein
VFLYGRHLPAWRAAHGRANPSRNPDVVDDTGS